MRTRCRVSLRLCNLYNMQNHRHTFLPCQLLCTGISLQKHRIIPRSYLDNLASLLIAFFSLETSQNLSQIFLCSLVVRRNRNSVAVIPNRHNHRHLQSTRCIDSFPKMPFRRRCISDCPKSHFLPIVGEFFRALEFYFFINIRRQSQPEKSRHLPCCRRYIG